MSEKIQNAGPEIRQTNSRISAADRRHHILARLAINRGGHRVAPGLYSLGRPDARSPVLVTANYRLSFDALRSSLAGVDCYLLVLDTKGINVWCAAGKGTFGTDELVDRIRATQLHKVVKHRRLILPQLGAPGVAAHLIKQQSGFHVEFGPVYARDIKAYLEAKSATKEMRRVQFNLLDRLLVVPVEVVTVSVPSMIAAVLLFFLGGPLTSAGALAAILAGVVLFPILLPWLPTANFSTKGFILGGLIALPFAFISFSTHPDIVFWQRAGWALAYLCTLPAVTAFLSLNFTGSTTFTSRSGVKREIFKYAPVMAWMFGGGLILSITVTLINKIGG
ncbi:MAG: mercury methylation corrinoid protein HgcA [Anaerolineae bacterium]